MKLLWIVKSFPPEIGGVQQYSFNYIYNMPVNSCVVLTEKNKKSKNVIEIDNLLKRKGFVIHRVSIFPDNLGPVSIFKSPLLFIFFILKIFYVINFNKITHVLFAHPSFFYFYAHLILKNICKIPFICFFHGEDIPIIKLRSNNILKWMIKHLDGHFCNSMYTYNRLSKFVNCELNFNLAYPGVEEKFFELAKKINLLNSVRKNYILYTVGRLDERKGHDFVIKSLPDIIKIIPNIKYIIGGKGSQLKMLQELVNKLSLEKYVEFKGFVEPEEIVDFHNYGDIFVMVNRNLSNGDTEGFGIVFLEAAACGKPAIGGNAGGVVEAIVNGETGFLIDPDNQSDFIDKVVSIYSSPVLANRLGAQGRERVENNFKWSYLANHLLSKLNGSQQNSA